MTNTTGVGAERSLPCLCGCSLEWLGTVTKTMCPACTLEEQILYATALHGGSQDADEAVVLLLFTDGDGRYLTKTAAVSGWQEFMRPLQAGKESISGHSGRRSGAKNLARIGWPLWMVQFLG